MAEASSRDGSRLVARIAVAQTVWTVVVALLWIGGMMWLSADQDYTSGELLDHLLAWMNGEPLYSNPQQLPYRVFNYPPLGMAVVRAIAELGMPALVAGRLFGTAGIVAALWVVYAWLLEAGIRRTAARVSIALSGLSFPLMYSMGQFHLEGFAVALTLMGARLLWRGDRDATQFSFVVAGVLMAVACFVKQSQTFSLVVVLAWLMVHRRQFIVAFATSAILTGLIGALAMYGFFGAEVWRHVFTYTVGTYSLGNLSFQLASHALPWLPMATIAWYHTFSNDRARRNFQTWYLAGISCLLVTAARTGSGFQYFLEWQLVVLLLVAPVLQQFSDAFQPVRKQVIAGIVALMFVLNAGVAGLLSYNWQSARSTQLAFQNLCAFAARAPLLTPTENPGAARACGARSALHPFIIANLTARGMWDERAFVNDLMNGRYAAIIVPFNPGLRIGAVQRERWSPAVLNAMREAYHPLQMDRGWWLLAPVNGTPANRITR